MKDASHYQEIADQVNAMSAIEVVLHKIEMDLDAAAEKGQYWVWANLVEEVEKPVLDVLASKNFIFNRRAPIDYGTFKSYMVIFKPLNQNPE